jgi:O-antigen ligase
MKLFLNKAIIPALYLLAISPLFYYKHAIPTIIIVIAGVLLFWQVPYKQLSLNKKAIPFIACFSILTFYFLFYFHNKSLKHIGDSFIIFILPLAGIYLSLLDSFKVHRPKIMLAYCVVLGILCGFFICSYIADIPLHSFDWYLARYNLELKYKIHGTYICLWIAVAILFLTHYAYTEKIKSSMARAGIAVLYLLYFAGLIIYNSRNIMIGLIIIAAINTFRLRKKIPFYIKMAGLAMVVVVFFLSQRYLSDIKALVNSSVKNSTRYTIVNCSYTVISDSHFMGTDYSLIQDKLNQCYSESDNPEFKTSELNSHNQYLDYFMKGGILLFIAFIALMVLKIWEALRQKEYLYLALTVLFVLSFITENVLTRQYGIFIYAFCDILFLGNILLPLGNKAHAKDKIIEG